MSRSPLLIAALTAARRGWFVFPLVPGGKTPAVREWERRATTDRRQIYRWWVVGALNNIGVATGPSGLVVIDLDHGRGQVPPVRFAGARDGRDALAMLAAEVGEGLPANTYEVSTPSGGSHLYFRAPEGLALRNTSGALAWKTDSRAGGGYVVGAGSVRAEGYYRVTRPARIADLPAWLAHALTPSTAVVASLANAPRLPEARASAYVNAIVEREAHDVAAATQGTRHHTLLRAARTLGRLVGGGELDEATARDVLHAAAAAQIGVAGTTLREVTQTIDDGIAYGRQAPRRIRHLT